MSEEIRPRDTQSFCHSGFGVWISATVREGFYGRQEEGAHHRRCRTYRQQSAGTSEGSIYAASVVPQQSAARRGGGGRDPRHHGHGCDACRDEGNGRGGAYGRHSRRGAVRPDHVGQHPGHVHCVGGGPAVRREPRRVREHEPRDGDVREEGPGVHDAGDAGASGWVLWDEQGVRRGAGPVLCGRVRHGGLLSSDRIVRAEAHERPVSLLVDERPGYGPTRLAMH